MTIEEKLIEEIQNAIAATMGDRKDDEFNIDDWKWDEVLVQIANKALFYLDQDQTVTIKKDKK